MNYHITLLSPVHIGSGKHLTPLDFACVDDILVVPNLKRLLHAAPHRAKELGAQIAREQGQFSLTTFLSADECRQSTYRLYSASLGQSARTLFDNDAQRDVAEFLKTPLESRMYIPGSSLKGAFRTALAYGVFRRSDIAFQALKEFLQQGNWRQADKAVNELVFWGARRHPKYDLFRALRIDDSSTLPATPETLQIDTLKILSLYESRKPTKPRQGTMFKQLEAIRQNLSTHERSPLKPGWTFLETLPAGTAAQGTCGIDNHLLQNQYARNALGWKAEHQKTFSKELLLGTANAFALDICQWELDFFEQHVQGIDVSSVTAFYRDLHARISQAGSSQCYLCMGHGAGWHKSTLGLLLEKDPAFNFRKLRKDLRLASDRLQFPYPKSRKVLMKSADEMQAVPGWVCLEFSE
jgi:CRISPR-associated protein Csm5